MLRLAHRPQGTAPSHSPTALPAPSCGTLDQEPRLTLGQVLWGWLATQREGEPGELQALLQPQREPPPFTPLPIKTRHLASSQCILEHSHGPLCFPEALAASPRSPAPSDAPGGAPRFSAQLKQMFSMAAWVQVDPWGALGGSRTTDTIGTARPATCAPTEAQPAQT